MFEGAGVAKLMVAGRVDGYVEPKAIVALLSVIGARRRQELGLSAGDKAEGETICLP